LSAATIRPLGAKLYIVKSVRCSEGTTRVDNGHLIAAFQCQGGQRLGYMHGANNQQAIRRHITAYKQLAFGQHTTASDAQKCANLLREGGVKRQLRSRRLVSIDQALGIILKVGNQRDRNFVHPRAL
jgi:hypothetical protein